MSYKQYGPRPCNIETVLSPTVLFHLAIEPLGHMLCQSDTLQGFQIPGEEECLIVTLFTDDMMVYLKQNDDIGNLFDILNKWCIMPGAKFNMKKTIIPSIGDRKSVV